jgi:predicted phage tail protein|tara:strand:- start:97 stop:753 length:657 start_codon:yes stop_codon:yes gene_type:complete
MKVVKVYGALRKRLGQCRFEFDVTTPAQAIKALCVNFPGLEKWLIDSEKDGVGYRVAIRKEKVSEDDLTPLLLPFSDREVFSITPVVAGAGRGAGSILAGALLITAAVLIAPGAATGAGFLGLGAAEGLAATTAAAKFAAIASSAAGTLGIGLALNGVAQAISPQPGLNDLDESVQLESFSFSNVVNTSRQGLPVPIAYGRVVVGSAVISSNLDVAQE